MQVTLIGHASVLIEAGEIRLLTDPWLIGSAFNDSWSISTPPAWQPTDVAAATHVWISHEHPDHLSIPTLTAIPAADRARLTVLFQRTWSSAVVDHLRTLGFASVVELVHGRPQRLVADLEVTCWQVGHQDSALVIRHGSETILNLNDCKPSGIELKALRARTGPIDLLLDQFSIAGWAGNRGDQARLAAAKQGAVTLLLGHVAALTPARTLPFASSVRFSHVENAHLNEAVVRYGDLAERWTENDGQLVLLQHGDTWSLDAPSPPVAPAVALDQELARAGEEQPLTISETVDLDQVREALESRMAAWRRDFTVPILRRIVEPVRFELTDLDAELVVDPVGRENAKTTVRLASQPAWFAGAQRFGAETLLISGRFELSGPERGWRKFKRLGGAHAAGVHTASIARAATTHRGRAFVARRWRGAVRNIVARS